MAKITQYIKSDLNHSYGILSLVLIFFSFSVIGWIWEVILHIFTLRTFINRGVLYGPWLPIYGAGGVLLIIALKGIKNKPVLLFAASIALCGAMEYFTSWILEKIEGMKWWDYSSYFLNINGRVCLEGVLLFAVSGCAAIYLIAPALDNAFTKIPKKYKVIICVILLILFIADLSYSYFFPNTGFGITSYE